jgi:diacylglycerol kinase family enzyme
MNPEARKVTPAIRHVVEAALEGHFKLESTVTEARNAAIDVARAAVEDGNELIIAFGGDGLLNEVANGMVGSDAVLGIVPGGTMNVFARNLGVPNDPLEAVDRILGHPEDVEPHSVPLARANDRLFTFACGCGFDGEAATRVEEHYTTKRRFGEPYFYAAAFATFLASYLRRAPFLSCQGPFGSEDAVGAIAVNAGPYAYLAGRPVRLVPASVDPSGIGLFVLKQLQWWRLPEYATGAFLTGRFGGGSKAFTDIGSATVSSDGPFFVHVDGEPLDPVAHVELRANAGLLKVIV